MVIGGGVLNGGLSKILHMSSSWVKIRLHTEITFLGIGVESIYFECSTTPHGTNARDLL